MYLYFRTIDSLSPTTGVGTALLGAAKQVAIKAGCKRLWLITTNDNLDALCFYHRRGFVLVAVHRNGETRSRKLKSEIPEVGAYGIPLRDEAELMSLVAKHEPVYEQKHGAVMLGETLSEVAEAAPFVTGQDGFYAPRSSLTMPGSGWIRGLRTAKFKTDIQRGQRFAEASWFTPMVNGYSRTIPLRCFTLPAPSTYER